MQKLRKNGNYSGKNDYFWPMNHKKISYHRHATDSIEHILSVQPRVHALQFIRRKNKEINRVYELQCIALGQFAKLKCK